MVRTDGVAHAEASAQDLRAWVILQKWKALVMQAGVWERHDCMEHRTGTRDSDSMGSLVLK